MSSKSDSKSEATSPTWRTESMQAVVKRWRKELADCTLYKYALIRTEWSHGQQRDSRYTGMTGIVMKENVGVGDAFYVYFADCSLASFHINELDEFNPEEGEDGAHFFNSFWRQHHKSMWDAVRPTDRFLLRQK